MRQLETKSLEPSFWDDPTQAQKIMQHLSALRQEVATWSGIEQRVRDTLEFLALAQTEDDDAAEALFGDIAQMSVCVKSAIRLMKEMKSISQ